MIPNNPNTAGQWYSTPQPYNYCPYCGHSLSGPHAPGYYGPITSGLGGTNQDQGSTK